MIYHYTDRDSARKILLSGVIRARPVMVYTSLFGGFIEPGTKLAPAVWFTTSDSPAPTVVASMMVAGWPIDRPGMIWRFGVADRTVADDLVAWAEPRGYSPDLFSMMLRTAALAGDKWDDWRLSPVDVSRADWLAVQSLHGDRWIDAPAGWLDEPEASK